MTLYIATKDGDIPMSPEDEAKIKAEWAANAAKPATEKPKSLEDRVSDLESAIKSLPK